MIKCNRMKYYQNKTRANQILIILIVIMISLFTLLSPLQTFCIDDKLYEISEELGGTVVEELNEIVHGIHYKISGGKEELLIKYEPNIDDIFFEDELQSLTI